MSRPALAMALPLLLGACATQYPTLFSAPATLPKPGENGLDPILVEISDLQAEYGRGYKETAQFNDWAQVPIIGAAGAAAWILLKDKADAADKVGKIAVGTGVYAATKNQLAPVGLTDAYIKGYGALNCVLAEGPYFAGETARTRHEQLKSRIAEVVHQAEKTTAVRHHYPADESKNPEGIKAARAIADLALTQSSQVISDSLAQAGAFEQPVPTFRNAASNISLWVASKGRVRPNLGFDDLMKQFPAAAVPKKPANGQGILEDLPFRGGVNATIVEIAVRSRNLSDMAAALKAETPDYRGSLVRVVGCATALNS